MDVSMRNYREMSRDYLLRILEKEKQNKETYPISTFSSSIRENLEKAGFFKEHKRAIWWRLDIYPNCKHVYSPIYDADE